MKEVTAIVDLQFGSCGKGQIAGTWALKNLPDTAVTANGPNAGHSFRWGPGPDEKVVFTVLPCAAVVGSVDKILIGPGAVINLDKLQEEIAECYGRGAFNAICTKTLIIHPRAAVVLERHREAERELVRIGSTMKGTAEAVIEKIRRTPEASIAARHAQRLGEMTIPNCLCVVVSEHSYMEAIADSTRMIVEGSQGHSLGIHTKFYPYTTSRDVSVHQLLADCRIPRDPFIRVIGVCRTYPIRVANRFDEAGRMVGTSGPFYADQVELDWEADLKRPAELTTVTKLPRRVFSFSYDQIIEACAINRPFELALTFADYLEPAPEWLGALSPESSTIGKLGRVVSEVVERIELAVNVPVKLVSYGPLASDIARLWSNSVESGALFKRWR